MGCFERRHSQSLGSPWSTDVLFRVVGPVQYICTRNRSSVATSKVHSMAWHGMAWRGVALTARGCIVAGNHHHDDTDSSSEASQLKPSPVQRAHGLSPTVGGLILGQCSGRGEAAPAWATRAHFFCGHAKQMRMIVVLWAHGPLSVLSGQDVELIFEANSAKMPELGASQRTRFL